jgi:hypothetical protein
MVSSESRGALILSQAMPMKGAENSHDARSVLDRSTSFPVAGYRSWAARPESAAPAGVSFIRLLSVVYSTLPAGTVVLCRAHLDGQTTQPGMPLAHEGAGMAIVASPSGTCAVEVPVWLPDGHSPSDGTLRYEVDLESPGDPPKPLQRGVLLAFPVGRASSASRVEVSLGSTY